VDDLNRFVKEKEYEFELKHLKIELSSLSQMINIMRSNLGSKPLSHGMKDPEMLKAALNEMMRI